MPTEGSYMYSSEHLVISHLGVAYNLMLRTVPPVLIISLDFRVYFLDKYY